MLQECYVTAIGREPGRTSWVDNEAAVAPAHLKAFALDAEPCNFALLQDVLESCEVIDSPGEFPLEIIPGVIALQLRRIHQHEEHEEQSLGHLPASPVKDQDYIQHMDGISYNGASNAGCGGLATDLDQRCGDGENRRHGHQKEGESAVDRG